MQAAIREALIGLVNAAYVAAYPTVPIVYDNTTFDRNSPPQTWVEFEIKFMGGDQVGMSWSPKTRVHGFVYVTVWSREGAGTKSSLLMCDWFSAQLAYQSPTPICLQAAEPVSPSSPTGFHAEGIKLYFYSKPG